MKQQKNAAEIFAEVMMLAINPAVGARYPEIRKSIFTALEKDFQQQKSDLVEMLAQQFDAILQEPFIHESHKANFMLSAVLKHYAELTGIDMKNLQKLLDQYIKPKAKQPEAIRNKQLAGLLVYELHLRGGSISTACEIAGAIFDRSASEIEKSYRKYQSSPFIGAEREEILAMLFATILDKDTGWRKPIYADSHHNAKKFLAATYAAYDALKKECGDAWVRDTESGLKAFSDPFVRQIMTKEKRDEFLTYKKEYQEDELAGLAMLKLHLQRSEEFPIAKIFSMAR